MPNYAMQMEMIRWGIETGCSTYNFGGVLNLSPDNGLYKFKVGFCKEKGLEEYIGEIENNRYNRVKRRNMHSFCLKGGIVWQH